MSAGMMGCFHDAAVAAVADAVDLQTKMATPQQGVGNRAQATWKCSQG
jgi:hypothetical protein